jgi:hypothetical protein
MTDDTAEESATAATPADKTGIQGSAGLDAVDEQ